MSGYGTRFENMECTIYEYGTDNVESKLKQTGQSYKKMLTTWKVHPPEAQVSSDKADHIMLWHRRLKHLAADKI